jgi:hypothetical protein
MVHTIQILETSNLDLDFEFQQTLMVSYQLSHAD